MGRMLKYNNLDKKVNQDQVADNSAFDSDCMKHWVVHTKTKKKWRHGNGGQLQSLTVSADDPGDLLDALESTNNVATAGVTVIAVTKESKYIMQWSGVVNQSESLDLNWLYLG
jgi:hypothetical protein